MICLYKLAWSICRDLDAKTLLPGNQAYIGTNLLKEKISKKIKLLIHQKIIKMDFLQKSLISFFQKQCKLMVENLKNLERVQIKIKIISSSLKSLISFFQKQCKLMVENLKNLEKFFFKNH